MVWGLWATGNVSLKELQEDWSISDVLTAHVVLAHKTNVQQRAIEKAQRGR